MKKMTKRSIKKITTILNESTTIEFFTNDSNTSEKSNISDYNRQIILSGVNGNRGNFYDMKDGTYEYHAGGGYCKIK